MTKKDDAIFPRLKRACSTREGVENVFDALGGNDQRHLVALWQNWRMVMGESIAGLAFPLGHKEKTLCLGVDDSMALQEISLQSPEILERANAFMDKEYFDKIKVVLLQGQRALSQKRPGRPADRQRPLVPPRPDRLGALHGRLAPDSPVTRCYEVYVAMYDTLFSR